MADIDDGAKTRRLHWDGTVTAGNVLTALAMFAALVVWGLRVEGRVDSHDARLLRLEKEGDEQRTLANTARERLAGIEANISSQLVLLQRMDRQLDRLLSGQNGGR